MPDPQTSAKDLASSPGFWQKPEKDQIATMAAASPKFKAFAPEVQRRALDSLHKAVQGRNLLPSQPPQGPTDRFGATPSQQKAARGLMATPIENQSLAHQKPPQKPPANPPPAPSQNGGFWDKAKEIINTPVLEKLKPAAESVAGWATSVLPKLAGAPKEAQDFATGLGQGLADAGIDMTTPANAAMIAAMVGIGAIPGVGEAEGVGLLGKLATTAPKAAKILSLVPRVAKYGFMGEQGKDLLSQIGGAGEAYKNKDYTGIGKATAKAVADTLLIAAANKSGKSPKTETEVPKKTATGELQEQLEQAERSRTGVTAKKTETESEQSQQDTAGKLAEAKKSIQREARRKPLRPPLTDQAQAGKPASEPPEPTPQAPTPKTTPTPTGGPSVVPPVKPTEPQVASKPGEPPEPTPEPNYQALVPGMMREGIGEYEQPQPKATEDMQGLINNRRPPVSQRPQGNVSEMPTPGGDKQLSTGKEQPVMLQDFVASRGGFASPATMILRSQREVTPDEIRQQYFPDYGPDKLHIQKKRVDEFMGAMQPGRQSFELQFAAPDGAHISVPEGIEERLGLKPNENYHSPAARPPEPVSHKSEVARLPAQGNVSEFPTPKPGEPAAGPPPPSEPEPKEEKPPDTKPPKSETKPTQVETKPPEGETKPVQRETPKQSPEQAKQPWEMTRKQFKDANPDTPIATHGDQVYDALARGKPVPDEVLKDYPDLTKPRRPKITTKQEKSVEKPKPIIERPRQTIPNKPPGPSTEADTELHQVVGNIMAQATAGRLEAVKLTAKDAEGKTLTSMEFDTTNPAKNVTEMLGRFKGIKSIEVQPVGPSNGIKSWTKFLNGTEIKTPPYNTPPGRSVEF